MTIVTVQSLSLLIQMREDVSCCYVVLLRSKSLWLENNARFPCATSCLCYMGKLDLIGESYKSALT